MGWYEGKWTFPGVKVLGSPVAWLPFCSYVNWKSTTSHQEEITHIVILICFFKIKMMMSKNCSALMVVAGQQASG